MTHANDTRADAPRTRIALSPELLRRIDAIDGCQGRWIVDCRAIDGDYSFALRPLNDPWPMPDGRYFSQWDGDEQRKHGYGCDSPEMAALYCAETGWRARLLWCSEYLNDDCSWPGGYEAPSIYRSNARVFREDFAEELGRGADGEADGVSLDVRYVTDEMLECLLALEQYPLISEDDHSQLETELQDEAWERWARSEWQDAIRKALEGYCDDDDWDKRADAAVEAISEETLSEWFRSCQDASGEYWFEDGTDQYIRVDKVAKALTYADLRELTGLLLLPPDQQWRREPYPWPGAEPGPLVP
jgi:hypothetical protein